jgi:hypothetical protein
MQQHHRSSLGAWVCLILCFSLPTNNLFLDHAEFSPEANLWSRTHTVGMSTPT